MNKNCIKAIRDLLASKTYHNDEYLFQSQRRDVLTLHWCISFVKTWCSEINLKGNYGSHTLRKTWGYHKRVTFGVYLPRFMVCFIRHDILKEKRARYGEEILPTLSAKLVPEFGSGFGVRNLSRMVRFAEVFPEGEIVVTLSRQLSWSHFVEILSVKDSLARNFYAEMCRMEYWSVRTLRSKIGTMLFERTALSRKPEKLIEHELKNLRQDNLLTPDLVFRDPYFLDFLGLKEVYQEKDFEAAILRELESFIMELGAGFSFVARQKRIIVDGDDFYLDLLFYHRDLRKLVVIEARQVQAGTQGADGALSALA